MHVIIKRGIVEDKMKNIMFIAPPAAGKGTQAEIIVNKYNIPHISTGDILRDISKENSEIGNYVAETLANGLLVKDEITYQLVLDRLSKDDCKNGFIIDGFPRNYEQALAYDDILKKVGYDLGIIIVIEVDKETLAKRITGRRVCKKCGSIFNINNDLMKPKNESICDICGGDLYQRSDDNLDAFMNRFATYEKNTEKIINHYKDLGVLHFIDGNRTIDEISKQINEIIESTN